MLNNQYNELNQFNQTEYNHYNQPPQELKVLKDIEIKFFRLLYPLMNDNILPLNGVYNDIDNIEEDNEHPLMNKFSSFEISPYANITNLFSLIPNFGRVYSKETLEGIITFSNISEHEVYIKDLEISLIIDAKPELKMRGETKNLKINLPKEGVLIHKKMVYSVKFSQKLELVSKYTILINVKVRSSVYDYQYNNERQRHNIKHQGKDYKIVDGSVEVLNTKRLTFDVNFPYKTTIRFHNYQMKICYIEVRVKNDTVYPLTITDAFLLAKMKPNIKLTLIEDLEQLNRNKNQNFISESTQNLSKYLTLEQDEEVNFIFKVDDPSIFIDSMGFALNIKWLNLFDGKIKDYIYEFKNELNIFNDYYRLSLDERPNEDIIKGQNFKITLVLEGKNLAKKYYISLSKGAITDINKSNNREIEIIDIIDKKIELSQKYPKNYFIILCKSDFLGNVCLPKLKFTVTDENKNIIGENTYDELLFFHCKEKEE